MPLDRARFLDLFVLFPGLLYKLSLAMPQKSKLRDTGISKTTAYFTTLPDMKILYRRLRSNQRAAISQMIATGVIDVSEFRQDRIKLNTEKLPPKVVARVGINTSHNCEVFEFLLTELGDYEFTGPGGLLDRAGIFGGTHVVS